MLEKYINYNYKLYIYINFLKNFYIILQSNINDKFVIENELSTDAKKFVESFNNYYINAGVQLSNNIPYVNGSHLDYLDYGNVDPLLYEEATENKFIILYGILTTLLQVKTRSQCMCNKTSNS